MTKLPLFAALAAAILAAAPASAAMTVGTFVTRANALKAQGPMALVSPDFTVLRAEAQAATAQLKAEREARRAKGLKPIACVPQGQSIGILDMLEGLAALPAADQKLPLKDGYARVIAKRFPC
ncbi:MAG TPA: hypothetical protein VF695_13880 [Sphingomonas sp.]